MKKAIWIFILAVLLCGCANKSQPDIEQIPETVSYSLPYPDIVDGGGELGWYRPGEDDTKDSFETVYTGCSSDRELIERLIKLLDTSGMKSEGHADLEELQDINQSVNDYPSINLDFDGRYFVMIYRNNVVVTNTFYSEGELYERLSEDFYDEHGYYPPVVTDGYIKYISGESIFDEVLALLAESEPPEVLPEWISCTLPYPDLVYDEEAGGWRRAGQDYPEDSSELCFTVVLNDPESIEQLMRLTDIGRMKNEGRISWEEFQGLSKAVSDYPSIGLNFQNRYLLVIYKNDTAAYNKFRSDEDIFGVDQEKYFEEHGYYPAAIAQGALMEGYSKYVSDEDIFQAVYDMLSRQG